MGLEIFMKQSFRVGKGGGAVLKRGILPPMCTLLHYYHHIDPLYITLVMDIAQVRMSEPVQILSTIAHGTREDTW